MLSTWTDYILFFSPLLAWSQTKSNWNRLGRTIPRIPHFSELRVHATIELIRVGVHSPNSFFLLLHLLMDIPLHSSSRPNRALYWHDFTLTVTLVFSAVSIQSPFFFLSLFNKEKWHKILTEITLYYCFRALWDCVNRYYRKKITFKMAHLWRTIRFWLFSKRKKWMVRKGLKIEAIVPTLHHIHLLQKPKNIR